MTEAVAETAFVASVAVARMSQSRHRADTVTPHIARYRDFRGPRAPFGGVENMEDGLRVMVEERRMGPTHLRLSRRMGRPRRRYGDATS